MTPMNRRRLLYLSAHQLAAWRWRHGTLTGDGAFAATADGLRLFADYLARQRNSVFTILANVGDEGFQIETIPLLRGADRRAIIARKLGQLYFNSALTTSQSLGYEKSQRQDERVLLAALTDQAGFAPWLAAIATARVALAGIYSLPFLAPSLLRRLAIGDDRCLLLTVQDRSMRQSYLENGELVFSRLAPLADDSDATLASAFDGEAHKLRQYLLSQRLISRQQTLTAYLLAHANAAAAITQACVDSETMRYAIVDIGLCAERVGWRGAPPDSHSEQLFLALLASAPPRQQFADARLRRDHRLRQIRSALYRTGAAALAAGVLASATLLLAAQASRQQSAAIGDEAALARARYGEIVSAFPPIPTDRETLRRVVDRYRALEKQSATPDELYREISRALRDAPAVEIDSIDWQAGDQRANGSHAGDERATAVVRGTLKLGADAGARQLLAAFDALVESLTANRALQVAVLQRPVDIESSKSLKGDEITLADQRPRSFALRLWRKTGP